MGDFVDRGFNSVETFQLLMCLKLRYPGHITLLRGNHETRQITTVYGFYDENMRKYGNSNPWKYCVEVFDHLGIGAVVEGKIFCIHGGLSPDIKSLDQIRLFERRIEVPHEGSFSDLMWSDPADIETWALSPRGAGWLFGSKVTEEFNHINDLKLVARAHQLVMDGFQYWFKEDSLVTVWSAPNYCYRCANVASILNVSATMDWHFEIFHAVEGQM
jgi:diadenosine tetraphosphatase ApaH/serine/threonine PP2A family protein phosphatase